jgi:hypothetical protein
LNDSGAHWLNEVARALSNRFFEEARKIFEAVIPAKAGIQHITDLNNFNILDPGFRRGDNVFFNNLLIPHDPVV